MLIKILLSIGLVYMWIIALAFRTNQKSSTITQIKNILQGFIIEFVTTIASITYIWMHSCGSFNNFIDNIYRFNNICFNFKQQIQNNNWNCIWYNT